MGQFGQPLNSGSLYCNIHYFIIDEGDIDEQSLEIQAVDEDRMTSTMEEMSKDSSSTSSAVFLSQGT